MLFNLLTSLIDQYSFLNVFKYLTFRTGLSVVTSLIGFYYWRTLIKFFRKNDYRPYKARWSYRHIIKSGTPTMGGVIIIVALFPVRYFGLIYPIFMFGL